MTLIVEDGTGILNSQTYATAVELKAYASLRNISLPSSDIKIIEGALVRAMDYLETKVCYKGNQVDLAQSLLWPREYVYINDVLFAEDAIPKNLKTAQILLAIESLNGVDLMPTVSASDFVIKEKVGPLEIEYADPSKVGISKQFIAVDALLESLIGEQCLGNFLTVYRA